MVYLLRLTMDLNEVDHLKALSVSKRAARHFLLDSQCLLHESDSEPSVSGANQALEMINKLECVQLDPVSVVERNQNLVLASRIPDYLPKHLDQLLASGNVFEYIANEACVIPIEDYPMFKPVRNQKHTQLKSHIKKVNRTAKAVLSRLKEEGPLPSRAFKSDQRVHGYWDNSTPATKETSHALNLLLDTGKVRVVKRDRTERFFGLTEATLPEEVRVEAGTITMPQARKALIEKYMRAYRLFDERDPRFGWQKIPAAERRKELARRVRNKTIVPVEIQDVNRQYYLLAEDVERLQGFEQTNETYPKRIRFLAPLDNMLWRRERLEDLFGFYYRWEIYTPRDKRRYGPYAMPILYGDQLIGRMDPLMDRKENRLTVRLLQLEPEVKPSPELKKSLETALHRFAAFHQADSIIIEKTEPEDLKIF